jgi:hypothetical protein
LVPQHVELLQFGVIFIFEWLEFVEFHLKPVVENIAEDVVLTL